MRKLIIGLLLAAAIISSTFIGVLATEYVDPHIIKRLSTESITIYTNCTNQY